MAGTWEMPARTKMESQTYENADVSNDVDLDRKIWQTFSRSAVNAVMANFLMTSIRSQAMKMPRKSNQPGGKVRMDR